VNLSKEFEGKKEFVQFLLPGQP